MDVTGWELPAQAETKVPYAVGIPTPEIMIAQGRPSPEPPAWLCSTAPGPGCTSDPGAVGACQPVCTVPQRQEEHPAAPIPRTAPASCEVARPGPGCHPSSGEASTTNTRRVQAWITAARTRYALMLPVGITVTRPAVKIDKNPLPVWLVEP
jgi:hypothetical protein